MFANRAFSEGELVWSEEPLLSLSLRDDVCALLHLNVEANETSEAWAGCTPLMLAAGHGDSWTMRILLENFNLKGRPFLERCIATRQTAHPGYTALHFCAENGFDNCVELLLQLNLRQPRAAPERVRLLQRCAIVKDTEPAQDLERAIEL